MIEKHLFSCLIAIFTLTQLQGQSSPEAKVVKVYDVERTQQAVAVDDSYFYVINNHSITKHDKENGEGVVRSGFGTNTPQ